MSKDCPYCPPDSQYEAWGYSPEGWQQARENHEKNHCDKCPKCGQVIEKLATPNKQPCQQKR